MDTNQEAFVHHSPGNVQSFLDAVNTIKPTTIIGKKSLIFCTCVTIWNMQKEKLRKNKYVIGCNVIDFFFYLIQTGKPCAIYAVS